MSSVWVDMKSMGMTSSSTPLHLTGAADAGVSKPFSKSVGDLSLTASPAVCHCEHTASPIRKRNQAEMGKVALSSQYDNVSHNAHHMPA